MYAGSLRLGELGDVTTGARTSKMNIALSTPNTPGGSEDESDDAVRLQPCLPYTNLPLFRTEKAVLLLL